MANRIDLIIKLKKIYILYIYFTGNIEILVAVIYQLINMLFNR